MSTTDQLGRVVLAVGVIGIASVLLTQVARRVRLPAPLLLLVATALATHVIPALRLDLVTVERVVTLALIVILFDGGQSIGWRRIRPQAGAVLTLGVLGTVFTAGVVAALAHLAFGFGWYPALLLGAVIAPTDPAVVFSVMRGRELGSAGTVIEGESGANDPVGIALVAGLLGAGHVDAGSLGHVAGVFALQMVVGAAIGVAAAVGLERVLSRLQLEEALPVLLVVFAVALTFGVTVIAHGSGFLAVFVLGICWSPGQRITGGDTARNGREPDRPDRQDPAHDHGVVRLSSTLAGLGEIVAFVALGTTIELGALTRGDVIAPAAVLFVAITLVIRPIAVALCLTPCSITARVQAFVAWAGLKGAVPILLGVTVLDAGTTPGRRIEAIVVLVVGLSVLVQGATIDYVATRFGLTGGTAPE